MRAFSRIILALLLCVGSAVSPWLSPALAQTSGRLGAPEDEGLRSLRLAEERRDWRTAIHLAKQLRAEDARDGALAYRIARAHLRLDETEQALEWLYTAVDDGYSDLNAFERDGVMRALEETGDFEPVARAIAMKREERFDDFLILAAGREPVIREPEDADPAEPAPVLLVLHDDGGRPEEAANAWADAAEARDMVLVAPSAIRRIGSGFEWRHEDESEWVLLEALAAVERRRPIDRSRIFVGGFEAGGTSALRLALRDPEFFAGLVLVTPRWDEAFGADRPPTDAEPPPVYITGGARDPRMPGAIEVARALKKSGVRVHARAVRGVGFRLPESFKTELRNGLSWVARRAR